MTTHQSAQSAVLAGVIAALNVAGMTALSTVWNNVPQGTAYPYAVVSPVTETRLDTMGRPGKSVLIDVHVFSQYAGDKEALAILSKAVELLHYQAVTVAGHTLIAVQYEQGTSFVEDVASVKTRHHVGMFRVDVVQG